MALYINLDSYQSGVRRHDLAEDPSSFDFPTGEAEVDGPVNLRLQVARDGSMVMISGHVEARVRMTCGRCLVPMAEEVGADLREIYHLIDGPPPYRPDEDEGLHFVNRRASRVDLAPAVREQVLLEIPIKPLCRPECLGLCPECGTNLNEGRCDCEARPRDARWGPLSRLAERAAGREPADDPESGRP